MSVILGKVPPCIPGHGLAVKASLGLLVCHPDNARAPRVLGRLVAWQTAIQRLLPARLCSLRQRRLHWCKGSLPRRSPWRVVAPGHALCCRRRASDRRRKSLHRSLQRCHIVFLHIAVHEGTGLPCRRQGQGLQVVLLKAKLPGKLLDTIELHRADSLEHRSSPSLELRLESLHRFGIQLPVAKLVDVQTSQAVLNPNADVRVQASAPLSLHRTEESLSHAKQTWSHQASSSAVRKADPRIHTHSHDVLQVKTDHQV